MSLITTINDVANTFLSRREITCNFAGLGGKLKKLDAVEMVKKEFKLDSKIVIPIKMATQTGRSNIVGTFYVYDDEKLAKQHVDPTVFQRIEKVKKKIEEKASEEKQAEETKEAEDKPKDEPAEKKAEDKPKDEPKKEASE